MSSFIENGLKPARGYFNRVEYRDGTIFIDGWLLVPGKCIQETVLFINGKPIRTYPIIEDKAVLNAFDFLPEAKYSGFSISEKIDIPVDETINIAVVAIQHGMQIGHLKTCFCKAAADKLIDRDKHLMHRVAHTESRDYFRASGFKSFLDFSDPLYRNGDLSAFEKILDWGCGCGRLVEIFGHLAPHLDLYGCDIDPEAVNWSAKNLSNIHFDTISPLPPTQYPDNFFDAVIGNSVLTHLTREVQFRWLEELNRIVRAGGLVLATVHGEFATFFQFRDRALSILAGGIHDGSIDNTLGDIAPKGYYRGTYQSREYTEREFGRYFEIVDYIERGSLNFQDLIVMRKREA